MNELLSATYDEKDTIGITVQHTDASLNAEVDNFMASSEEPKLLATTASFVSISDDVNHINSKDASLMRKLEKGNATDTVGPILCARCDVDLNKTGESANKLLQELKRRGDLSFCML